MKTKIIFVLAAIFIISSSVVEAQYGNNIFSINLSANYTTTSKLYLNPNVADPILRGEYSSLNDIYNFGAELRYRIAEPIIIGLNVEYIEMTGASSEVIGVRRLSTIAVTVNDGYRLIPIELSVYYLLPFSSDKFKFYMGGGIGTYIGSHIRTLEGIEASNAGRKFAFGIQVGIGMEYLVTDYFSINGGMKFRDPEFEMTSKYSDVIFMLEGEEVLLRDETFDSKVNIDGVTFYIGLGLGFNLFN